MTVDHPTAVFFTLLSVVAVHLNAAAAGAGAVGDSSGGAGRIFSAADFGAVDDGATNNTAAFSACLDALIAAGGGRMVLPVLRQGIYQGKIIIPPMSTWTTVEIVGAVQPTPVFGTVGAASLCSNCSHAVVQSLETVGPAAVISVSPGGSGYESFSNVFISIQNLEVRTYNNPNITGIDLGCAQQCSLQNVFVNTGVYGVQAAQPTHGASGLVTPTCNNGAYTMLRNVVVSGYYTGILVNEHTDGDGIVVAENVNGLRFLKAFHASRFGRVGAYRNTNNIDVMGTHGFSIQQLAIEVAGPKQTNPENSWQKTIADINDPNNQSLADITYWVVEGDVGSVETFVKIGGAHIQARRIGSSAPACDRGA